MTDSAAEANFTSQTIWTGDNLPIMRGMNSETVDLVYLDPPFNSNADYSAPIGSEAAGAEFKDTWGLTDIDLAWCDLIRREQPALHKLLHAVKAIHGDSMMSYLIYMTVRLQEMHRLLKPTGSIWLHCDPTAGHYLKVVMDAVFGKSNFRNDVVWHYYNKYAAGKRAFGRNYDTLLFYAGKDAAFTPQREEREAPVKQLIRENVGGVLRNKRGPDGKVMYRTVTDRKVDAVWRIPCLQPAAKERIGYPTQKPLALLRRIVRTSSRPGDMVLDPFCGCATACIAAEMEGRRWAGIDISPKAADLVKLRMAREMPLLTYRGTHRTDIPIRTDLGKLPPADGKDNKEAMYERQEGYCAACAEYFQLRNLTVDHVVSRSRGGSDHISNLQLLCGACNSMKGDRPMEYLARRLAELDLIDEAQQRRLATARVQDLRT